MAETFLGNVAKHILEKYPEQLGDLFIVTPNRRAWLFLRKHMSFCIGKPAWSPLFISIEDFAKKLTGLQVPDSLELLFEFYEIYKKLEGAKAGSLDSFIHWGKILLEDFDEVESSLEKPNDLYTYLTQLEYINNWSPDGQTTIFQQRHLLFVSKFGNWHQAFREHLIKKNRATKGMAIREAAQKLKNEPDINSFHKVIFVGFNAFTWVEEQLVTTLFMQGKAEIIFDTDPYYEQNENHEAGYFIRKYRSKWNLPAMQAQSTGFNTPKNIKIIGVARSVLQAQVAGNIITENEKFSRNTDTAIVLANESLVLPVLSALPLNSSDINVTMGYPLNQTGVASLCEIIFKLFDEKQSESEINEKVHRKFYYKDLIKLILHPVAKRILTGTHLNELSEQVAQSIIRSQRVFLPVHEIQISDEAKDVFFRAFPFLMEGVESDTARFLGAFKKFCTHMQEKLSYDSLKVSLPESEKGEGNLEWEASKTVEDLVLRVEQLIHPYMANLSILTLKTIFLYAIEQSRLTFSGEPIRGLQVMGMLETRSLDFKNLILLSTNEKLLPGSKKTDSFIPFTVKKKFKMHLHFEREAIFAYHFYRLLQRAENVCLIYNIDNEGLGGGEKSRYIVQLEHELPKYQPNTTIVNTTVAVMPKNQQAQGNIIVEKNVSLQKRLLEIAASGFSPTSLSTFIKCPLKFYFEKVEGLKAPEETEETLQANTIGSVLHKTLQLLYQPYKNKILSIEMVDQMLAQYEKLCDQQMIDILKGSDITKGKNLLLANLTKHQLKTFLQNERKNLDSVQNELITLLDTEVPLSASLQVRVQDQEISVFLKGTADRIDQVGHKVRIVDYKSGSVSKSHLTIKSLEDLTTNPKYEQAFQLMMYNWLFFKEKNFHGFPESAIISLKKATDWLLPLKLPNSSEEGESEHFENFQLLLTDLLAGLFDPTQPFRQTEELDHCRFCNFSNVCNRFPSRETW